MTNSPMNSIPPYFFAFGLFAIFFAISQQAPISIFSQTEPPPLLRQLVGSVFQLENMTECRLGYTALLYNEYGCYCGWGGSGTPMDDIDECCRLHDKCYDNTSCWPIEEKLASYNWSCTEQHQPSCLGSKSACASELCHCDKEVVECWAKYPKPTSKPECLPGGGGAENGTDVVEQ